MPLLVDFLGISEILTDLASRFNHSKFAAFRDF